MIDTFDFIDVWRYLNPELWHFTRWEMTKTGLVQSRLDLISIHLLYDCSRQDIAPGIKSDHSVDYFQLEIENSQKPGRGFFKFNSTLLKDLVYVNKTKNFNDNLLQNDGGLNWDVLKCEVRGYTIAYATKKKE